MRFTLCLLVGLAVMVTFNCVFSAADLCMEKCTDEENDLSKKICTKRNAYGNLCVKKCADDRSEIIECEKGTYEDCWNNDCTAEEKDPKNTFCYMDPKRKGKTSTNLACNHKCGYRAYEETEIKWVDC